MQQERDGVVRWSARLEANMKILKYCGWYLVGFGITATLTAALYAGIGCVMVACNVWKWSTVVAGAIGTGIGTGLVNGFVIAWIRR